jgi:hypothetical protein
MGVRRLDIRFGNIAGQGATLLFVGGASHNIGGISVACNSVGRRKRCDRPRAGRHSIGHLALAEDKRHKEDKRCQEEAAAKQHQAGVNLHLFALAYSYE